MAAAPEWEGVCSGRSGRREMGEETWGNTNGAARRVFCFAFNLTIESEVGDDQTIEQADISEGAVIYLTNLLRRNLVLT